jgi:23S rRNA (uridine2552-2'-O)-methyltransferase
VVDLGAAPGGWSQVAADRVKPRGRVIAIDLLPIAPISGVTVLTGDLRSESLDQALGGPGGRSTFGPVAEFVGHRQRRQARALELITAAIDFCCKVLKPEGVFVLKRFTASVR